MVSLTALGTIGRVVHVLFLAVWFGAGLAFMMIVAPDVFDVLDSRQAAGDVIAKVVDHLDLFGLVAGPVILLSLLVGYLPLAVPLRLRAAAAVVMTVLAGVSGRWLSPRMVELRNAMGRPIDDVAASDPLKVQFTNLHTASEAMMFVHVALALLLLVAAVVSTVPKRKHGIEL